MTPSPSSPSPRRTSHKRGGSGTFSRQPTLTDAFAEVLLPRSTSRRGGLSSPGAQTSTPRMPKKPLAKASKLVPEASAPLAIHDGNSVIDRVRKWQEQGGGVIEQPEPVVYPQETTPMVKGIKTSKEDHPKRPKTVNHMPEEEQEQGQVAVGETANVALRAKSRLKTGRPASAVSVATPKKRIVSDEHWMKKGENKTKVTIPVDKENRKDETKGGFEGDGIRVYPSGGSARRSRRRKSASESPVEERVKKLDDDGIRVYSLSNEQHPKPKRRSPAIETSKLQDEDTLDKDVKNRSSPWPKTTRVAKPNRRMSHSKRNVSVRDKEAPAAPFADKSDEDPFVSRTLPSPVAPSEKTTPPRRSRSPACETNEPYSSRGSGKSVGVHDLRRGPPRAYRKTISRPRSEDRQYLRPEVLADIGETKNLQIPSSIDDLPAEPEGSHAQKSEKSSPEPYLQQDISEHVKPTKSSSRRKSMPGPASSGLSTQRSSLKRRLDEPTDLTSSLSLPEVDTKTIKSSRSVRTTRSGGTTFTIMEIMEELEANERKYTRELYTLVDGVIPVLLTCVLSKSDSAVAAGLFGPDASHANDLHFTRPIIDMGIALERLKTLHKRIPLRDTTKFLRWAQGARKVYLEYIKSWRLGFQDVVVNLAPALTAKPEASSNGAESPDPFAEEQPGSEGLPRNADGDVINSRGERVDVAYLMKRPLVRIRHLAKTLMAINQVLPSALAEEQASAYRSAVIEARNRMASEDARMEDEKAASVDSTRVKNLRTLAFMTGVSVDRTFRVTARDSFDMHLQHSSGQIIDCRVEIYLRENQAGKEPGGDMLICETNGLGRVLLFPPILRGSYSARTGDSEGEVVVMIRGSSGSAPEWYELLALQAEDGETALEWVQMLGLIPVPPAIEVHQPFLDYAESYSSTYVSDSDSRGATLETPERVSSPSTGEPEVRDVKQDIGFSLSQTNHQTPLQETQPMQMLDAGASQPSSPPLPSHSIYTLPHLHDDNAGTRNIDDGPAPSETSLHPPASAKDLEETMMQAGHGAGLGLRRTRAKRLNRRSPSPPKQSKPTADLARDVLPVQPDSPSHIRFDALSLGQTSPNKETLAWELSQNSTASTSRPRSPVQQAGHEEPFKYRQLQLGTPEESPRSSTRRRILSSPSMIVEETMSKPQRHPRSPLSKGSLTEDGTVQASSVIQGAKEQEQSWIQPKSRPATSSDDVNQTTDTRPQPGTPPSRRHDLMQPNTLPKLQRPNPPFNTHIGRRSSSPLKHEYAPSSPSESAPENNVSGPDQEAIMSYLGSSEEEEPEVKDVPMPLRSIGMPRWFSKRSPPASIYSQRNTTLTPSESASQVPYKSVPAQPSKAFKILAKVMIWNGNGVWEKPCLQPCKVVVTPGLVEVYPLPPAHSMQAVAVQNPVSPLPLNPSEEVVQPLIRLVLTPVVPLNVQTGLDVYVKSPPAEGSKLLWGSEVMFRTRCPTECEVLYKALHRASRNNPTYAALQAARVTSNSFTVEKTERTGGTGRKWLRSWGGGLSRSNSYRAPTTRASSVLPSEKTMETMDSSSSAMRILGTAGRFFNIAKSSVGLRGDSPATSVQSFSTGSSPVNIEGSLPAEWQGRGIGRSRATKLHLRVGRSNDWKLVGKGEVLIMPPPPDFVSQGPIEAARRVVVIGKVAGEVLLDVCLEDGSYFGLVGRAGVSVKITQEPVGPNGEVGQVAAVGGVGSTNTVYLLQMGNAADAAYVYSLVGGHMHT